MNHAPEVGADGDATGEDLDLVQCRERRYPKCEDSTRDQYRDKDWKLDQEVHPIVESRRGAPLVVTTGRQLDDGLGGYEATPQAQRDQVPGMPSVHVNVCVSENPTLR